MPQMAPLMWLSLFIFFLMSFMMFNIMNYFNLLMEIPTQKSKKKNSNSLNWKW